MFPKFFNVLLIEDDPIDAEQIQRALSKSELKHKFHHARNGEEALALLEGENGEPIPPPHFILLDINLPRMNGLEFLQALRAHPRFAHTTVFMLTSSNAEEDRSAAFRHHVAGYIIKPVTTESLNQAVARLKAFVEICEFPH